MKRETWIAFAPFYLLVAIIFLGISKGGSEAVTAINQQRPVERQHTIVIDAGHGVIDGGATSCTGILESQINLEIALKMEDLFHFLGYETVMIRRTDESIYIQGNTIAAQKVSDLNERVRIVNKTPGAILISIHQNTFSDNKYSGAQVFFAPTEGSRELARRLQGDLASHLNPGSNRKEKKADNIYLLQHISRPGVLIECGFISNPQEEARLRDPDYQRKLCAVIASSLSLQYQ